MADFTINNQGTIVLFTPQNEPAKTWLEESVDPEAMWLGKSLVVEHRYADGLAEGMVGDGWEVEAA